MHIITFRLQIWQSDCVVTEPAILHIALAAVVDRTVVVEVLLVVEGVELGVVDVIVRTIVALL